MLPLSRSDGINLANSQAPPLSKLVSEAVRDIHQRVENHPFFQKLQAATLDPTAYYQYLVDLKHIYLALEEQIEVECERQPLLREIFIPELKRTLALEADLNTYHFQELARPVSQAAEDYANYLRQLAKQNSLLLAAHAYIRYLGDRSGGMIIKQWVNKKWPDALHFYDFTVLLRAHENVIITTFNDFYKNKFDKLDIDLKTQQDLVKEACLAFEYTEKLLNSISL